jgi:hypothetical protein
LAQFKISQNYLITYKRRENYHKKISNIKRNRFKTKKSMRKTKMKPQFKTKKWKLTMSIIRIMTYRLMSKRMNLSKEMKSKMSRLMKMMRS